MEKFKLCLQLLLALNFLLLNSNYVYGQEHKIINVEKVGEITGSEKIFLGAPTDIEVINGEVFIADLMDLKIKVFSSEGEFLREIGGRGRGPGEFQHFTAMWKGLDGNTINVMDYLNRKIVTFSTLGELVEEKIMKEKTISWPREVHPLSKKTHLVLFQPLSKVRASMDGSKIFHVFGENFGKIEGSFSLPNDLSDVETIKKVYRRFMLGSSLVSDSTLFFAPNFYEGKIYSMKLSGDHRWSTHNGIKLEGSSYEMLSPNDQLYNDNDKQVFDYRMRSGSEGTFIFRLYNITKALFETADGYIAHFVEVRKNGKKQQGIELYNKVGSFIGYQPYYEEELRSDRSTLIPEHPKAMDENNRVYTINRKGEVPVISIYQFEYQQ